MPSEFYQDPGAQGYFAWLAKAWDAALRNNSPNPELYVARAIAERAAQRAEMDGAVIRSTGEVVPKESV